MTYDYTNAELEFFRQEIEILVPKHWTNWRREHGLNVAPKKEAKDVRRRSPHRV